MMQSNKGDEMAELEQKIKRARSIKALDEIHNKLSSQLHGSWIAYIGYDREAHVQYIKRLLKLIAEKTEKLENKA